MTLSPHEETYSRMTQAARKKVGPDNALARSGLALLLALEITQSEIAANLAISRAAVSRWNCIPVEYVPQLEALYKIPRWILRPDHYHHPKKETVRWRAWVSGNSTRDLIVRLKETGHETLADNLADHLGLAPNPVANGSQTEAD